MNPLFIELLRNTPYVSMANGPSLSRSVSTIKTYRVFLSSSMKSGFIYVQRSGSLDSSHAFAPGKSPAAPKSPVRAAPHHHVAFPQRATRGVRADAFIWRLRQRGVFGAVEGQPFPLALLLP